MLAVVCFIADHDTQNAMRMWAEGLGFDLAADYDGNPRPADRFDFHCTLVASANDVAIAETQHIISPVTADAIDFDVLGVDRQVPVLALESEARLLRARQFFIETYGIEPTFAEFKPHVSLSYAWSGTPDLNALPLPAFPLVFDQLRVAHIDDGAKSLLTALKRLAAEIEAA